MNASSTVDRCANAPLYGRYVISVSRTIRGPYFWNSLFSRYPLRFTVQRGGSQFHRRAGHRQLPYPLLHSEFPEICFYPIDCHCLFVLPCSVRTAGRRILRRLRPSPFVPSQSRGSFDSRAGICYNQSILTETRFRHKPDDSQHTAGICMNQPETWRKGNRR